MVAKAAADTPSEVHTVQSAGSSRSLARTFTRCNEDATGSRWQVLSEQKRDPNDEIKTTAATDRRDFH